MTKSIAAGIPIAKQGIPFAVSAATIWEAHRAKKALPMRLPISSTLRNPQKQRSLPRHKKMHTAARVSVSQRPPPTQKIYPLAGRWNIVQFNSSCNPASGCLPGENYPTSRPSSKIPKAFKHSLRLDGQAGGLSHLLGHGEAAGLGAHAAHADHHRLHAQWDRGGHGEVDLRDAGQADRRSGEGNRGRDTAHGDGDGQLRARQVGRGGAGGRTRSGDQERGGIAVAGDEGDRGLALPGGGRWRERTIGSGEQAGGGGRRSEGEARDLAVVVDTQNRQADSGLIGNLHVDLSGRHVVERGADTRSAERRV